MKKEVVKKLFANFLRAQLEHIEPTPFQSYYGIKTNKLEELSNDIVEWFYIISENKKENKS